MLQRRARMAITPEARDLLEEVLGAFYASTTGTFPGVQEFRLGHESQRALIDELVETGYLRPSSERYVLTLNGLRECSSPTAKKAVEAFDSLLPRLKEAYRQDPQRS